MRREQLEIYSDRTNAAVIRHPGRNFPGLLLQGDTLYNMYRTATAALSAGGPTPGSAQLEELVDLRDHLGDLVAHYKRTLLEHGLPLPFVEGDV